MLGELQGWNPAQGLEHGSSDFQPLPHTLRNRTHCTCKVGQDEFTKQEAEARGSNPGRFSLIPAERDPQQHKGLFPGICIPWIVLPTDVAQWLCVCVVFCIAAHGPAYGEGASGSSSASWPFCVCHTEPGQGTRTGIRSHNWGHSEQ